MARLPTAEEIGALPSALSNRPIAKYDTSGYARGAAAIAEGLGVLGRGIGRAADGFEEIRRREERNRLDRAKANAGYLVVAQNIRSGMAQESDPDAVAQTYPQAFRDAYPSAADTIGDPEARKFCASSRNDTSERRTSTETCKEGRLADLVLNPIGAATRPRVSQSAAPRAGFFLACATGRLCRQTSQATGEP